MAKIPKVCVRCGAKFSVYPARQRAQDARGIEIKFCSRACTDLARSEGKIGSRKREGKNVPCNICGTLTYRKQNKLRKQEFHFCSEPCRVEAQRKKLLDRSGVNSGKWMSLNGGVVACAVCGAKRYKKKSLMREGNLCSSRQCASDYRRSLWSLPPRQNNERKRGSSNPERRTEFTAVQKRILMGPACIRCGTSRNLCLDHIIPVCAGGESKPCNAQTLCQPCNNLKSKLEDMPLARAVNNSNQAA